MGTLSAVVKKFWWLFLVLAAVLLILIVVAVGMAFRGSANEKFTQLQGQYESAECDQVIETGKGLTGIMRMALDSSRQEQLDADVAECTAIAHARDHAEKSEFTDATEAYSEYLAKYSDSALFPGVQVEAQEAFLDDADDKAKNKQYPEALKIYQDFMEDYPKSKQIERAQTGYLDTFTAWVDSLYRGKSYEETLDACEEWGLKDIPGTQAYCVKLAPDVLWNWGQQLSRAKEYGEALEAYEMLVDQFPASENGSKARLEIPKLYYAWGVDLYDQGQKGEAVSKFLEALKLVVSSDPIYKDIWENYPEAFIAYAEWLRGQGELMSAIEVLDTLRQSDLDDEIIADAESEYVVAVEELAGDNGAEGQSVLARAKNSLCAQKSSPIAIPSINFFKDRPGKAVFCSGGEGYYPAGLLAKTPGELRYYVKFSSQQLALQTCQYGDGSYVLTRTQLSMSVEIRFADTLGFYASQKFYGSVPGDCPGAYFFYSKNEKLFGGDVDKRTVQDWLTMMIV